MQTIEGERKWEGIGKLIKLIEHVLIYMWIRETIVFLNKIIHRTSSRELSEINMVKTNNIYMFIREKQDSLPRLSWRWTLKQSYFC